jgi:hypothetical protein
MRKYVVAFLLTAFLPVAFLFPFPVAGQFGKMAKKKLNGLFTAQVDFSKMHVSFLRKFPRTYLVLEDFRMTGTGTFEGDTLVACRKAAMTFGLGSVIRRKHIEIKSVILENPRIYTHVSADGQANWQILKRQAPPEKDTLPGENMSPQPAPTPDPPPESRPESKKAKPQTRVSVGKIEICDADITFRNDRRKTLVSVEDMDVLILGDKPREDSMAGWTVQLQVGDFDLRTGDRDRLQDMRVGLTSKIYAAPDYRMFGWDGSYLRINDMGIRLSGSAGKRDSGFFTDFS